MKHIKYLRYLLVHKLYVFWAGIHLGVPLWRLMVHDWTKFLPGEYFPYLNHFYAGGDPRFDNAWRAHQRRNSHHWQFHLLVRDTGETVALEIPENDVREMVADWAGANRAVTGKWGALGWYFENHFKINLNPATRSRVCTLINNLNYRGLA